MLAALSRLLDPGLIPTLQQRTVVERDSLTPGVRIVAARPLLEPDEIHVRALQIQANNALARTGQSSRCRPQRFPQRVDCLPGAMVIAAVLSIVLSRFRRPEELRQGAIGDRNAMIQREVGEQAFALAQVQAGQRNAAERSFHIPEEPDCQRRRFVSWHSQVPYPLLVERSFHSPYS